MEETKKKFTFKDLGKTLGNALSAIFKGELLLRLKIDKYFMHIVLVFLLILGAIWISLLTDRTMTKVERNNQVIREQQFEKQVKIYEIEELSRRSKVKESLKAMGSSVGEASQPVTKINE